jgi:RNA polymerase sigma-70 factor, ECF subfamily
VRGPVGGTTVHETDLALIERLRQGDPSALDAIVRQHQKNLYRLAYRMTRNAEDAKDISQEAFLRAYRGMAGFDGRSSLATWLYRITVNLCLTHLRQQRSAYAGEIPQSTADPSDHPLATLEEHERLRAVADAVAMLPPQQRLALVLRVHHNLPYQEIAEIIESTEGTVRANYCHAVAKLRAQLKGFRNET